MTNLYKQKIVSCGTIPHENVLTNWTPRREMGSGCITNASETWNLSLIGNGLAALPATRCRSNSQVDNNKQQTAELSLKVSRAWKWKTEKSIYMSLGTQLIGDPYSIIIILRY